MIRIALAAAVLLFVPLTVEAEEEASVPEVPVDYEALARGQTIVWFKASTEPQILSAMNELANGRSFANLDKPPTFKIGSLSGVVLNVGAVEANAMLSELDMRARGADKDALDSKAALDAIEIVEPDGIVELFDADCGADDAIPITTSENYETSLPDWLLYTGAPLVPKGNNFKRSVWIVDSGISRYYDKGDGNNELKVERGAANDRSARCLDPDPNVPCTADTANPSITNDRIGHGTMIAGIIGAKANGKWFKGVAPGVNLIAIKAFRGKKVNWMTIYKALIYVGNNAQPGDVVNISFGGPWSFAAPEGLPKPNTRGVEELLRTMVTDKGLRIAIAAGNIGEYGDVDSSGYVQTISPARAGGFRDSDGMIMTTSAVGDSNASTSVFAPTFWEYSAYGNKCGTGMGAVCSKGPPDFAEPGVDITSLWPGVEKNTCSGTSFSSAVLAGLLVQGTDIQEKAQVMDDPTGADPSSADANDDWVGSCLVNENGACKEVAP